MEQETTTASEQLFSRLIKVLVLLMRLMVSMLQPFSSSRHSLKSMVSLPEATIEIECRAMS
jgi:hypothetical protein